MSNPISIRQNREDSWSWSINNKPIPIDQNKKENIPIGDRHTIFLGNLFTNTFLIDLELLGIHKTVYVNFTTTKDYSFSLHHSGNRRLPYNVIFREGTEKWGLGNVRNLEKYFEGLSNNRKIEFNITIYKKNSYTYIVGIEYLLPEVVWVLSTGYWDMNKLWKDDGIWIS